jgi:GT2 family glycosyltransferase
LKVSVIIVNYNGSRFLIDLFNSLRNQTFKDFEVIFIDNNSTDNSLELLDKNLENFSERSLQVKIVKASHNLGYCKGNNLGLKYAQGEYIVFLNNDTYVTARWLEELLNVARCDPSIGACQSRHMQAQTDYIQTDGWGLDKYGWSQCIILNRNYPTISKKLFYASGSSMIVKRSALDRVNGFDPELFFGDFDLCWRLRMLGYNMADVPGSICYHYGSIATNMVVIPTKAILNHDREVFRVFLKNYGMKNIVKRVPMSAIIMIVEAAFLTFKYRNPLFLISFHKALLWNLTRLSDTLTLRSHIQKNRVVSDDKIVGKMINYSVLLTRRLKVEVH